jgi:SAM-dependent methyltransferase
LIQINGRRLAGPYRGDMNAAPWFATWFDSPEYHRLYAGRDLAEAERFVDGLVRRLRPAPSARILDLGCGAGRHARRVAALGFDVTGLDLSANSIAQARTHATRRLRFRRHDMRRSFGTERYEIVLNLFTSFGYFDGEREHVRVLNNIARALTPGGTLVLDYLNAAYADAHRVGDETMTMDSARFRIARWTTATHLFKRITVEHVEREDAHTWVERVARFSAADFRRMLAGAGLMVEHVYGDYELGRFDPSSSPRLILIARKPPLIADRSLAIRVVSARAGAPRKVLADPAEGLGRQSEVGRNHPLRHALDDGRILGDEGSVALLGRRAEGADDPLVLGGVVTLNTGREGSRERREILQQPAVRRQVGQQQLGGLDGLGEILRRRSAHDAGGIGPPPILGHELDDVLAAVEVDGVDAEDPADDEDGVSCQLAGSLQEPVGRQACRRECALQDRELFVGEGGALRGKVAPEPVECGTHGVLPGAGR